MAKPAGWHGSQPIHTPDRGTVRRREREATCTAYAYACASADRSAESRTADRRTGTHSYTDDLANFSGYLDGQASTVGHADNQNVNSHPAGNLDAVATITHEDTFARRNRNSGQPSGAINGDRGSRDSGRGPFCPTHAHDS